MFSAFLLFAALTFTQADADFAWRAASDLVTNHTPRDGGTIRGHLAANRILDLASEAGADVKRDTFTARTPNGMRSFTNLRSPFVGDRNRPWTVLVSHYDTKMGVDCPGANDGAATTGLLIAMAGVLSREGLPESGNVLLLWTDGEECFKSYGPNDGLWGARRAVSEMQRVGLNVRAVICLDMLGDADLNISMPANCSDNLATIVGIAAKRVGQKVPVRRVENVVDDHVPFLEAGYPAIDLIDFDYGTKPGLNDLWHTSKDTMDRVSKESLLKSGQLIAELLNLLGREVGAKATPAKVEPAKEPVAEAPAKEPEAEPAKEADKEVVKEPAKAPDKEPVGPQLPKKPAS